MRITSKGQVTIPIEIRERLGLLPGVEVEFDIDGDAVRLARAQRNELPSGCGTVSGGLLSPGRATMNRDERDQDCAPAPPTLEELRACRDEILEIAGRHGVFDIRIYGSVARGEAKEGSDVDFLVDVEQGRSLFDLGGFYMDLRDFLGCEIDVGTEIKPRLREQVEAEAVPL